VAKRHIPARNFNDTIRPPDRRPGIEEYRRPQAQVLYVCVAEQRRVAAVGARGPVERTVSAFYLTGDAVGHEEAHALHVQHLRGRQLDPPRAVNISQKRA